MEMYRYAMEMSMLLMAGPGRVSFAASTTYTLGHHMPPAQLVHPN